MADISLKKGGRREFRGTIDGRLTLLCPSPGRIASAPDFLIWICVRRPHREKDKLNFDEKLGIDHK